MSNQLHPLILDLCEWVGAKPRSYGEVMDAWRTSCPRLTVWEDTVDLGFVARRTAADGAPIVLLTREGERFLQENGRRIQPRQQP